MKIDRAMVFAAGLGVRMRPLTLEIPKPLIKIAGKPLIDYTLDMLAGSGVTKAVVNTHHKAAMVEEYLKTRVTPKISISYEPELLETGGGVVQALDQLGHEPFFCCNTDTIVVDEKSNSLQRLMEKWDGEVMDMLLLLQPREQTFGYTGNGDFFIGPDGKLPPLEKSRISPFIFSGVQLISPRLLTREHPKGAFSLNYFYKSEVQPDGFLNRIYGLVHDGGWLHIGTPEVISEAEKILGSA